MTKTPIPIPDCVNERLAYDKLTGSFMWTHKFKNQPWLNGSPAGYLDNDGYCTITVKRNKFKASRVAWFMTYGEQPYFMDHINGIRADNRIANLRNVTESENAKNHGKIFNGSGLPCGVRITHAGNFEARIMCDKKRVSVGTFKTADKACSAYLAKRKELFGEYSREVV